MSSSRCVFLIVKVHVSFCELILPDDGSGRKPKHVVTLNKGPICQICMIVIVG